MCLEVEWSEGLMAAEHLKELSKTSEQRRSEKVKFIDKRHEDKKVKRAAIVAKKIGRGLRLKCALGRFNSEVHGADRHTQLMKFTRYELFKKLQFMAGAKKKVSKVLKEVKPLTAKSAKHIKTKLAIMKLKGKLFVDASALKVDRTGMAAPSKSSKVSKGSEDAAKKPKVGSPSCFSVLEGCL